MGKRLLQLLARALPLVHLLAARAAVAAETAPAPGPPTACGHQLLLIAIPIGLLFIALLLWRLWQLHIARAATRDNATKITIQTLVQSMVGVTDQECLEHMVSGLCQWLNADYCMLGEFTGPDKLRVLAMQHDNQMSSGMECSTKGSPCEEVERDGYCIYPTGASRRFPNSNILSEMQAEGYVGTLLRDREGRGVGVIGAISRRPMVLPAQVHEVMDIMAARALAEIERRRAVQGLERELALNRTLAELSGQLIPSATEISAIARIILDKARELTGSAHGFVSAIAQKTGDNICYAYTSMVTENNPDPEEEIQLFPRAADGTYPGLWGHALNTRKPFFSNTPTNQPAATGLPDGHLAINRFLSMPVLFGQELVGQIALTNPGRDYTEQDLTTIGRIADLYALALLNKRADEERELLTAELRHTQKLEAIGTLAGGIAHDFNNILSAILGYTELAKDDIPSDSQSASDLEEVIKAGNRARELVKQILTFSRQTEQEMRPLHLSPLVKETCKMLRSSVPSSIDILQHIDPECDQVLADPTQIHQLLMNLAANAVEAMGEKGVLEISLQRASVDDQDQGSAPPGLEPGTYVQLTVRDNGPGMDKATLERIFDPFFTTRPVGRGSGMGLPVVQGIVQSHLAKITVKSEPGQGASFDVFFPALQAEQATVAETADNLPGGTERILYVDDEITLVNMGRQFLERLGYSVTTETDSLRALDIFRGAPAAYDLAIVDQTLRNLTGLELTEELLTLRAELPVIITSGYDAIVSDPRVKTVPIRELILKPINLGDLAKTVRAVLDSR